MKLVSYTVYAKQQPLPLIGDEHYPDGCIGISFQPMPCATYSDLKQVIDTLTQALAEMART